MGSFRKAPLAIVTLCLFIGCLFIGATVLSFSFSPAATPFPTQSSGSNRRFYLGFDCNTYPGDDALPLLRKTFSFTGYWLSPPPGEKANTWLGKRQLLRSQGFGFLILYRGPESTELDRVKGPELAGKVDAQAAAEAAEREGFRRGSIIFLDIEEGGRLPPTYHAYIHGWSSNLLAIHGGSYQAGFYCSGIPVKEDAHTTISTAQDIFSHLAGDSGAFTIWAYNDVCPPSPGCAFPEDPPAAAESGIPYAAVWQFAQSPRRKEFTAHCPTNYHRDGNCYAPGDTAHAWFLDVNSATSPDPSGGSR
jgi:hypothetical protein